MKYYYFNKVAMAVLLALLLFFGTRTLIDIMFEEHEPATPGYEVAGAEGESAHGDKKKGADKGAAFIAALNKADPAKGEQAIGLCKVCHSFEKGGPNMIGPDLYGVVGHKIASHEGFTYTPALKGHDGEWTFENLNHWLENPQTFASGTSMAFPGIPDLQKRADVIAYLNKNSDSPLPIPEPAAESAAEEGGEAVDKEAAAGSGKPEILALLVEADPAKGEQAAALCKVCHTFEAGGANMVGPNLHNVVGAEVGHHKDFSYTPALKDKGGAWTYERLDEWLTNPQAFASGTTMAFPGIPDAKKRADVIAFLRKETDNPPPLPSGDAEAAPAEKAAPAEGEAKPSEEGGGAADKEAAAGGGKAEILALLVEADPAKGEQAAALCKVCHTFEAGGANMVGPNLHNVVGAEVGHHKDFSYTPALKDKGGSWTYERLDEWLTNPQAFASGTTMAFPGIPDAKKRADVIAFLRKETDNPPPLQGGDAETAPAEKAAPAEEAKPEEEAAPAEDAAPSEEPAAEEPAAEQPAAEEPAADEAPVSGASGAATETDKQDAAAAKPDETTDETIVVSPDVSADAPSEPHKGEPPSANQPQPVYPDDGASTTSREDTESDAAEDTTDNGSSQPQPVYPDGKPEGL